MFVNNGHAIGKLQKGWRPKFHVGVKEEIAITLHSPGEIVTVFMLHLNGPFSTFNKIHNSFDELLPINVILVYYIWYVGVLIRYIDLIC